MEKKRKLAKTITLITALFVAAIAVCLIFTACSPEVKTVVQNGDYTFGNYRVTVDVPTTADGVSIEVGTTASDYSGETLVETVERIRPTVVDVYASTMGGTSAGSGVIIGAAEAGGTTIKLGGAAVDSEIVYDYYYVATNHHVVESCSTFSVSVLFIGEDDSEEYVAYDASLIGGSPSRDIAVLRIARVGSEQITVADIVEDSSKVKVGTEVLAIGNPLGILGGTVTKGIVSATAREVNVSNIGTMTLMQTDAAINGGNSGGGLFDTSGRLVGIVNSGYETDSTGSAVEGLNFAIPANDAVYAATSLAGTYRQSSGGTVAQYGYVTGDTDLGISLSQMNIYESSTSSNYSTRVVAVTDSQSSPFYSKWANSYQAIMNVKINGEEKDSTSLTALRSAFNDVAADDVIEIEYCSVMVTNGFNRRYFLNSSTGTVTVTATQYVYTI